MIFQHPLNFVPQNLRLRMFILFAALTATALFIFQFLDQPLRTSAAPAGTVSFELAGTVEKARSIMDSWNNEALINGSFGLGFDFLFMPLYATTLSLGVLLAAERHRGSWQKIGKVLGWGAYLAVVFDSIENMALLSIMRGTIASPYPELAAWCAIIKFGLILGAMLYGLVGWLFQK